METEVLNRYVLDSSYSQLLLFQKLQASEIIVLFSSPIYAACYDNAHVSLLCGMQKSLETPQWG